MIIFLTSISFEIFKENEIKKQFFKKDIYIENENLKKRILELEQEIEKLKPKTLKECILTNSKYLNDKLLGLLNTEYEIIFSKSDDNECYIKYLNDNGFHYIKQKVNN